MPSIAGVPADSSSSLLNAGTGPSLPEMLAWHRANPGRSGTFDIRSRAIMTGVSRVFATPQTPAHPSNAPPKWIPRRLFSDLLRRLDRCVIRGVARAGSAANLTATEYLR